MLEPNRKTVMFPPRRFSTNTLMIKDLSITEQLDSKAMRAVHGGLGFGFGFGYPSTSYTNISPVFAPNNSNV